MPLQRFANLMRSWWPQVAAKIQSRIPDRRVLLIPSDCFFTKAYTLPEKLGASDVGNFAQLSIEGASPFPAEQLQWGYLHDERSAWVLAYATPGLRLQKLGLNDISQYHQVIPGFMTQYGVTFPAPTTRFICEVGTVSALAYEPGNPVPQRVLSRRVPDEILDDAAILRTRDALAGSLPADFPPVEGGVWVGAGQEIDTQGRCSFLHRHLTDAHEGTPAACLLALGATQIWQADVRSADFAAREGRARVLSQRLWKGMEAAAALAAVLLVLQLLLWSAQLYNKARNNKIERQNPAVTRILNQTTLVERLLATAEQNIQPSRLLELINDARPNTIFFTRVTSQSHLELEIEGESRGGVTPLNEYADKLAALPFVANVAVTPRTDSGRTSFDLKLQFREVPSRGDTAANLPANP